MYAAIRNNFWYLHIKINNYNFRSDPDRPRKMMIARDREGGGCDNLIIVLGRVMKKIDDCLFFFFFPPTEHTNYPAISWGKEARKEGRRAEGQLLYHCMYKSSWATTTTTDHPGHYYNSDVSWTTSPRWRRWWGQDVYTTNSRTSSPRWTARSDLSSFLDQKGPFFFFFIFDLQNVRKKQSKEEAHHLYCMDATRGPVADHAVQTHLTFFSLSCLWGGRRRWTTIEVTEAVAGSDGRPVDHHRHLRSSRSHRDESFAHTNV